MVDSIPEKGINLLATDDEEEKVKIGKPLVGAAAAFLSDPELWKNYENEDLERAETALRNWIAEMRKVPKWNATNSKMRRYTFSMLFELVTGERYEQGKHARYIRMWTTLFRYYSSRVQKAANIDGKMYTKTVYVISPARLRRPPYSLRLRIPWLAEHGYRIDERTMRKVNLEAELKPGHARNPRTEATMERRREEGRKRFNERYNRKPRKH